MRICYLLGFIFLLTTFVFSQNIKVNQIETITSIENGAYFYPQFSPDAAYLYFSSGNYQGLWKYNFDDGKIANLNNYLGAGFSPIFSLDGKQIIFRKETFKNRRKYSTIIAQNVDSGQENLLEKENRNLTRPIKSSIGEIIYKKNNNLKIYDPELNEKISSARGKFIEIQNSKIVVHENGNTNTIENLENERYLWISLSPDFSKILFTKAGVGTFISDLQGNIITELGYANAPVWSPDGRWIAYMVDEDNGDYFTASDIFVVSSDGDNIFQITDTENEIEMYPQWAPDGKRIVFNTLTGSIKIAHLVFE